MRRRALLATVGALSAGCLGTAPPRGTTTRAGETARSGTDESPVSTATTNPQTDTGIAPATDHETTTPCDGTDDLGTPSRTATAGTAEYRLTGLTTSTTTDRPSVRYILEPASYYSGDAVEREAEQTGETQVVVDVSEIDDASVREAVETAIRDGSWRSNTLPDGLRETVERVDFFTGISESDTYTHIGLTLYRFHPERPPAIEFDATVVDDLVAPGDPGVIELVLVNTGSSIREVLSGTVPPFGMIFATAVDGAGEFLLWRPYEEEGCISKTDRGWITCSIGEITALQPCERVSRRYDVLPASTTHYPEDTVPPEPGTYRFADSVTYSSGRSGPESELSFEVQFDLEQV